MKRSPRTIERKHRLSDDAYRGIRIVAFTACLKRPATGLTDPEVAAAIVQMLGEACRECSCTVLVYTIMPDHLHLLTMGSTAESDCLQAMRRFKALSGWWLFRHRPDLHWQKDFWDHVLRTDEDFRAQAVYIAMNPVRAGLATDMAEWPYTGSIGHDLWQILGDALG